MKKFLIIITVLLSLSFSANAQTTISKEQAIQIAQQEVTKRGGSLEDVGRVGAFFDNEWNVWIVGLDAKPTSEGTYRIGGDATVVISPDGTAVKFLISH